MTSIPSILCCQGGITKTLGRFIIRLSWSIWTEENKFMLDSAIVKKSATQDQRDTAEMKLFTLAEGYGYSTVYTRTNVPHEHMISLGWRYGGYLNNKAEYFKRVEDILIKK
jgi:hypothetical protein